MGKNKSEIKKILKRASANVKDFDIHQYHKVDLRKIKFLEQIIELSYSCSFSIRYRLLHWCQEIESIHSNGTGRSD